MSCELLEIADLGWHGLDGDRRLALRRVDDRGGFPWLTASKLPELILYAPLRRGAAVDGNLTTHVRTPEGQELVRVDDVLIHIGQEFGEIASLIELETPTAAA